MKNTRPPSRLTALLALLLPLVVGLGLVPAAAAQDRASAEFHHRNTPAGVELRIDVSIDRDWHLYHTDLGAPDAIGKVTTLELDTIGATFGEVRFPEPHKTQLEIGMKGRPTWAWSHSGDLVLWAFGTWDDEFDPDLDVWVTINGQTCSDVDGMCILWSAELDSLGPGDDSLFADFPADLRPEPVEVEPAGSSAPPAELDEPSFGGGFGASSYGEQAGGFGEQYAQTKLYHRVVGDELQVVARIEIADDWHLYGKELGHPGAVGKPTVVTFEAEGVTFGEPVFPAAHKASQAEMGEGVWIWTHDGLLEVRASGKLDGPAPSEVAVRVDGQTCSDLTGSCVLYKEAVASAGAGVPAYFAGFDAAAGSEAGTDDAGALGASHSGESEDTGSSPAPEQDDLWGFLLLCIGGGLFTLLMPCTYPMIPITISFFTKQAEAHGKPTIGLPLVYGLGIVLVFVLIGVVVGPVIIPFAQHWLTNAIIGVAFFYFAFVLLGMVTLEPPRFLMNAAGGASQRGGLLGVFLMGTTLVVTSFTCTAPIVGSILSVGASDGNLGRLTLGMAVFGLTMAVPFVALSLVPGKLKAMPSSGEWMNTLKVTLGFVELAAAFKFFSNWDVAKQAGVLPDEILLLIWIVILAVAAAYLLGFIKLTSSSSDRVSPGRALVGSSFLVLVGYLLMILFGYPRDTVMHAFLPGYSNGSIGIAAGAGVEEQQEHTIVKDDFDGALARARSEGKLLLVNLTGYT